MRSSKILLRTAQPLSMPYPTAKWNALTIPYPVSRSPLQLSPQSNADRFKALPLLIKMLSRVWEPPAFHTGCHTVRKLWFWLTFKSFVYMFIRLNDRRSSTGICRWVGESQQRQRRWQSQAASITTERSSSSISSSTDWPTTAPSSVRSTQRTPAERSVLTPVARDNATSWSGRRWKRRRRQRRDSARTATESCVFVGGRRRRFDRWGDERRSRLTRRGYLPTKAEVRA